VISAVKIPVELLIVAADPLVRDGLAARLDGRPEVAVAGRAAPEDAPLFAGQVRVVLWDLGPGPEPDLEALSGFIPTGAPVVALVGRPELAAAAWRAGARGILRRTADAAELVLAVLAAAGGLTALDPDLFPPPGGPRSAPPGELVEPLTPRELEVLGLIAGGLSGKEIAHRLGISEHTVKFHVNTIMSKLGARSRTEAVVIAARLGLIPI
jgi:two-component system nitrate/nitrite response regulator NarL